MSKFWLDEHLRHKTQFFLSPLIFNFGKNSWLINDHQSTNLLLKKIVPKKSIETYFRVNFIFKFSCGFESPKWPFLSFLSFFVFSNKWSFFVFFTAKKMSFTWMIIGAYFRINFVFKFSWWIWVTKTGTKTAFFGLSPVTSIFVTATSTATATGSVLFRVQGWAWKIRLKDKNRFYVLL